jgi:xanthine/uracil permease
VGFIFGAFVGLIIRLFIKSTEFSSITELVWQYVPWMIGSGLLFGVLSYIFPKTGKFVLEMIAGVEIEFRK